MSAEVGGQRLPSTAPATDGIVAPEPVMPTLTKRPIDEDVQFISSNPVKRRKDSRHEQPFYNAQPGQIPGCSAHLNAPGVGQATTPTTGREGFPSQLTNEVDSENRGVPFPTMENFTFPNSFPAPYNRPSRASEAVSPKHLPQAIQPHVLGTTSCCQTPPLPTVTLDQISCLDFKAPLNPPAMGMATTNFSPTLTPNQPLSQPDYMQLSPHNTMPFAMYSTGNLLSLPSLSHIVPHANLLTVGTSLTADGPKEHLHSATVSVEAHRKEIDKQATDSITSKLAPATTQATVSTLVRIPKPSGSQHVAQHKPPCRECARARQQQGMNHSLARGGHHHGTVPPLTSFWSSFSPQFGNYGQYPPATASVIPSPMAKTDPMSTCIPASDYANNTTQLPKSTVLGVAGRLTACSVPTQCRPNSTRMGCLSPIHAISNPSAGAPKPYSAAPTLASSTSSSRSGTPALSSTPLAKPASAETTPANTAPQKQPSPEAPPSSSSPTSLATRKRAQNLLVDIAETVEEIFPFEEVARRHGVVQRKVVEALAAVVQVPLLRCTTDKRRAGKLGSERMKEYREARKAWIAKETEAGRLAKGMGANTPAGASGSDGQERDGKEAATSVLTVMELVDLLPPTELPSPLTKDAFIGPW